LENKQDLRVIKTKRNIKNAFIEILLEKDFKEITVQNILDKALINRKTFYNHYMDKYDLADQMIQDFFDECTAFLDMRSQNFKNIDGFLDQVDSIYKEVFQQRDLILALWTIQTDNIDFYGSMESLFQSKYRQLFQNDKEKSGDIDFQAHLFSTFILGSLKYMLDSNKNYTAREVWNEVSSFCQTITSVSIHPDR